MAGEVEEETLYKILGGGTIGRRRRGGGGGKVKLHNVVGRESSSFLSPSSAV